MIVNLYIQFYILFLLFFLFSKEDGQPLESQSWSLSQNEALAHCWNKDTLLLHSNACQNFALSLRAPAWTNIFREEIEVEQPLALGN